MDKTKFVVLALVAVVALPAAAVAGVYDLSKKDVEVIEGHTVFVVMQKNTNLNNCPYPDGCPGNNRSEQGTAVAVLTRELVCGYDFGANDQPAFDGVLWFNDQFLVGEEADDYEGSNPAPNPDECKYRYPCGGTVYAVRAGAPDPFTSTGAWVGAPLASGSYQHSYRFVDPNDRLWIVDYWTFSTAFLLGTSSTVWITSPLNSFTADSGTTHCDPIVDDPTPPNGAGYQNPGTNGMTYSNVEYNAVLYMLWKHLAVNHTVTLGEDVPRDTDGDKNATNYTNYNGNMSPSYSPGNGTGNSHPFNPYNHNVTGNASHNHSAAKVDIYFHSYAPPNPGNRRYFLDDSIGSNACFHEHGQFSSDPRPVGCLNGNGKGSAY